MDIRTHLRLIWRYRLRILLLSILVGAAVFALGSGGDTSYRAIARLQVLPASTDTSQDQAVFLANSYAELTTTAPVLQAALDQADLSIDLSEAGDVVSTGTPDDLGFLTVIAEGDSESAAVALADAVVSALTDEVEGRQARAQALQLEPLDARIAELRTALDAAPADSAQQAILLSELDAAVATRSTVAAGVPDQLVLVEPAAGDVEQVSSSAAAGAMTAFLVTLILNAELAVGLHILADRLFIDDDEELEGLTGLPVLASIVVKDGPDAADAFREVRTALRLRSRGTLHRLAVVGTGPGSARAEVSIGVAEAIADLGDPVVLVDGDLRTPVIHDRFKAELAPGFGDLEQPEADRHSMGMLIREVPDEDYLRLLTAGRPVDDPGRLLALHLDTVLDALANAEVLVINTPDAAKWSDATVIASRCDLTILVVSEGARRRATRALADELRSYDATPVGIVVHRGSR